MIAHRVRIFSLAQSWILVGLVLLLMFVPTITLAKDKSVSAYEFVQEWITTYGVDHKRAATMMTTHHRGGMSEAEWVELYGPYLEYVKYKHLGGKLISTQEEKHKARIILKSTVDSIKGSVVQHEVYDLVKVDGEWLIDFINIQDENFGTVIGPEPTKRFDSKSNKPSPNHAPSQ